MYVLLKADVNIKFIKEEICTKFSGLVNSQQLIVREDLFIDAFHMSWKTRQKLKDVIIQHGEPYPEFGEKVPMQYKQLEEKIGEMRRKGQRIIPYSVLMETNASLEKPLSAQEFELFLQFQHNCGFILHFKDVHLKHMVILDPQLIIDATKSIVTSRRFALEVWDKEIWDTMVTTGKVDESYILKVWEASSDNIFYQYREYLLRLLQRLDIIARPKVYDREGFDAPVRSYYVPCMLEALVTNLEIQSKDSDITIAFVFKDLLPPAVVHKVFASCLSLWSVEANCLYNGWAALGSGRNHLLLLQRESSSIRVSIQHRKHAENIDINLVKSIKQFFNQTINRIVCFYGVKLEDNVEKVYKIEYNESAIYRGLGEETGKVTM